MTHKKPTKMSASSISKLKPKEKRYKPARYHRVIMFTVFIKKNKTTRVRICRKNNSFNIIKH